MSLNIHTFSNLHGGSALFKAIGHPLVAVAALAFVERLAHAGSIAIYDPYDYYATFAALFNCEAWNLQALYVQRLEDLGKQIGACCAQPITALIEGPAPSVLLVAAFDARRALDQIRDLVPEGTDVVSFDELRIPEAMLSNRNRYLDPINFATNFAFMRDADGLHTRVELCNYWSGYGATQPRLWACQFDADGVQLAQWEQSLGAAGETTVLDSREIRARFGLGPFTGSLFLHVLGAAGHDIVKYVIDTIDDEGRDLSCTHDANAWPSDLYAGLPAPDHGEQVVLWVQNSHPAAIPPGSIGLNPMGDAHVRHVDAPIPPFGTRAVDVARLWPECRWPLQFEVQAGKHFVRPRYEIVQREDGRRRIAHANVERMDLQPDPGLVKLRPLLGKGHILPAPVLPTARYQTLALPTPMATCQQTLALRLSVYSPSGERVLEQALAPMTRNGCECIDVSALLREAHADLEGGYGHLELTYDADSSDPVDGWLHALFRYRDASGNTAETSFGAHMYNLPLVYRNEPQSYAGPPPGLSTRLFLRLGAPPLDTFCHLIYPASRPWHAHSTTRLALHDAHGVELAARDVEIPCGGSLLWRYFEMFDRDERERAGAEGYVSIRDTTCRLFGYQGLLDGDGGFSIDHTFGF